MLSPCHLLTGMLFDTISDTTQSATRRNGRLPPARKSAYLSRFCNVRHLLETDGGGLWLPLRLIECR
jgi:hypothetical protein